VNKKLTSKYKKKIQFALFIVYLFCMCTENQRIRPVFPFTAIVGQEELKLALILNVIDPKIGGVLAIGDRGTGKTTTVRALLDLLPDIEVVCVDICQSHPKKAELISSQV
jgi:magnesium chelatase subunit I